MIFSTAMLVLTACSAALAMMSAMWTTQRRLCPSLAVPAKAR